MAGTAVASEVIRLIQEFEGCERFDPRDGLIHAYPDPLSGDEPHTIGWGTTVYPDGRRVRLGDVISRQQAEACLISSVQRQYWEPLAGRIPYWADMSVPMRAALCSFAYNLGAAFYGSEDFQTLTACLRERRWSDVPAALELYVNPGSVVEAGLRRRRRAEAQLWIQGLQALDLSSSEPAAELLEAITATFLKRRNLDSSLLAPHERVPVESGKRWKIERRLAIEGQSQQVQLAYGAGRWWIHQPHWSNVAEGPPPVSGVKTPQPAVVVAPAQGSRQVCDLQVPFLSQLDNRCNPYGSCNVTCVAMCLHYLGYPRRQGQQLEDQLYQTLQRLGRSRHDPYDLQFLISTIPGYRDQFRVDGSVRDIQAAVAAGNPVIVHGYFTSSGHIIVIRGYDERGFLVNDPYGEWFPSGYDTSKRGERLHYSYDLIARTCSPESRSRPRNIWFHTVYRA